jgi:hypothetical protein
MGRRGCFLLCRCATDALDRFGTRLEQRMTRAQIKALMETAGLTDIRFRDAVPFWCALGRKA